MTPMMKQYKALKEQHRDVFLFYRMGDFYELFFDDAIKAAPILEIALTKRGKCEGTYVPMCGVPAHSYENYVLKLLQMGMKVALCEQLETPQNKQSKGPLERGVVRILTPGTLSDDCFLQSRKHHFLLSLSQPFGEYIGATLIDVSSGIFRIESLHQHSLDEFLERICPSEIISYEGLLSKSYWKPLDSLWKKNLTLLPLVKFDEKNGLKRLLSLYKVQTLDAIGNLFKQEICSSGAALDYLELTDEKTLSSLPWPSLGRTNDFLVIDPSTRRNLELHTSIRGEKQGSLLYHMDQTVTAFGARLFFRRFIAPLQSVDQINKRLDDVTHYLNNIEITKKIRGALKECPDAERALTRILLKRGSPRDLGMIRSFLSVVQDVLGGLKDKLANPVSSLLQKLDHALIEDPLPLNFERGIIQNSFNATLYERRKVFTSSEKLIASLQDTYVKQTDIPTLKIKFNNIIGYHIEVPSSKSFKIPSSFIHRQTMATHMRYTTNELISLAKVLEEGEEGLFELEKKIFNDLIDEVLIHEKSIRNLIMVIGELDVTTALAHLAYTKNYVRPLMSETEIFYIEEGRHPVLDGDHFISNSCSFDCNHRFYIMTGPNMAGKSTYLRQNALILFMAHMGSFVPAKMAHIGICDRIFSRIGASDDLSSGKSTFMVEMIETATILRLATKKSFVLLDEVGRGTSTYDGLAIAWAVCEKLILDNQSNTFFATHYHELCKLSKEHSNVHNLTMDVKEWNDQVIFLHSVKPGESKRSYGIHVAQLAGVPDSVIQRSKELLKQFEQAA